MNPKRQGQAFSHARCVSAGFDGLPFNGACYNLGSWVYNPGNREAPRWRSHAFAMAGGEGGVPSSRRRSLRWRHYVQRIDNLLLAMLHPEG